MQENEISLDLYTDEEVQQGIQEIFQHEKFIAGMKAFLPENLYEHIIKAKDNVQSIYDFQATITKPFLKTIQQDSAKYTTEDFEQQYTYTSAKVISNTINLPNNFLTLDRGIRDGINTRMGVFDNQGIVGIVINSNTRYSKVMSILHRDSKISAKIARLNALGTLVWTSIGNPRIMELKYVPKHLNPKVDDIVQTSGASSYFPGGLPIGKIVEIEKDPQGGNFHSVKVELFNDLSTTRYVYIVNNLFKGGFKEIEEGKEDE